MAGGRNNHAGTSGRDGWLRHKTAEAFSPFAVTTFGVVVIAVLLAAPLALASTPGADVRLSNDASRTPGYVRDYTLTTGTPYTDATLTECSRSRGRENEPSVAVNPRNTQVIVGSSND